MHKWLKVRNASRENGQRLNQLRTNPHWPSAKGLVVDIPCAIGVKDLEPDGNNHTADCSFALDARLRFKTRPVYVPYSGSKHACNGDLSSPGGLDVSSNGEDNREYYHVR